MDYVKPDVGLDQYVNVSLVDIVTNRIRKNIYTGKYEPGKKLIVRELSEELGVSHTPIKDALNRLISEGYVEALPRKSMIVKEYSNRDFVERLEVRLMCELYSVDAVMEAIEKGAPVVEQLRSAMQKIEAAFENSGEDCEKWMITESYFHEIYISFCDNQCLLELYKNLCSQRYSYFSFLQSRHIALNKTRHESDVQAHLHIIEALENKDKNAFRNAIINHVTTVCEEHVETEFEYAKLEKMKSMSV